MQIINLIIICFSITAAATYIILNVLKYNQIKVSIMFFMILFVANIVSTIYIPIQFRFIYGLLIHSLLTLFILKQNIIKSISIGFIIMFMVTISEIIVSILLVFGFNIEIDTIKTNQLIMVILNVSIAILMSVIISFKKIREITKKLIFWFETSKVKYYIIVIILLILYLLVAKNATLTKNYNDFLLNLVFIIFISILLIAVLNSKIDIYNLNKANEQMMKYLNKYEKIITQQGKTNHEFKNQLLVIRGYADTNIKKLRKYLTEITKDIGNNKSNYLVSQLNNLPNGGLKGLFYYKILEMEERNLVYELYIDKKIKNYFSKANEKIYTKLTKVLGVCLDNAIEAASTTTKKEILMQIYIRENKAVFIIDNTFKNKNIITKLEPQSEINTKKRGYGLLILKEIINGQKSISINQKTSENTFITEVEISKPF